jgi:pimeloyl-ACP methyl ester carboxylesterase
MSTADVIFPAEAEMSTVVLLHALGTGPRMWAAHEEILTTAGHRVLVPDLYRLADRCEGEPSLDALAAALGTSLDEQGVHRAVLVGCSLGGYLAMALLRRQPERVDGLALISTTAAADTPAARLERLAFAERITDPALAPVLTARTAPLLLGATTRPRLLARVTEMAEAVAPADIAWTQRAIAARPASFDVLAGFSGPAVVLTGAEDELIPVTEARRVAEALPNVSPRIVPGAGHLLPVEAPMAVQEALAGLLQQREPV